MPYQLLLSPRLRRELDCYLAEHPERLQPVVEGVRALALFPQVAIIRFNVKDGQLLSADLLSAPYDPDGFEQLVGRSTPQDSRADLEAALAAHARHFGDGPSKALQAFLADAFHFARYRGRGPIEADVGPDGSIGKTRIGRLMI